MASVRVVIEHSIVFIEANQDGRWNADLDHLSLGYLRYVVQGL